MALESQTYTEKRVHNDKAATGGAPPLTPDTEHISQSCWT